MGESVVAWIESLPDAWQARVVMSASDQLSKEPGVVVVYVGGSLARGVGDVYSDVDLHCVVEDDALEFWRRHWSAAVARCAGRLVLASDLGGPIVGGFALTEAWEHIDFIVHARSEFQSPSVVSRPVYDPEGILSPPVTAEAAPVGPFYPDDLVRLFLYLVGNLVVTLGRGELIIAHGGVNALRDQLIMLMLAENGIRKTDGNKRLNPYLTEGQRSLLEDLPAVPVAADAITRACRTISVDFVARARRLAETTGEQFPTELLAATDRHLADHLSAWAPIIEDARHGDQ